MIITCPVCGEEFDNHADAWSHADEYHPDEGRQLWLTMTEQNFPYTASRPIDRPGPRSYQKQHPDVPFSVIPMKDGRATWCFQTEGDMVFFTQAHADIH